MAFNDGWTMDGVTFSGEATGADGAFLFPVAATGSTLDASGNGTLATTGSVRFTGHGGALDLTLSNLKVTVSGTTGTITADYSSKDMTDASKTNTGQGAVIATLADVTVSSQTTDGLTTWTISSPTVAFGADAPTVFGPNYKVGQAVDAMTLTVGTSASGATAPAPNGSTSTGTKTDTLSQATGVTTTNTPAPAGTTQAATSSEPVCQAEGYQVSSGSLSWGLKSSFLSYIQGSIAKGAIATSGGASRSGSGFTFAASSGTADPQAGTASIRYSGTVHFTGHEGKLDMTIANPTLVIASPTSGYLMLTVSSTDMQGNSTSYGAIRFAEVTFSSTSVTSSRISATASAVSLTAEGAKAFAGFYSAGQALDTLTASASLTDKIVCRNADGSLATTGADAVLPLTLIATFLAVSGGVVLAGARRRHATGRLSALR
ncbi:MAG: HtaA domain-containing protein [Actinomyces urogenitalis]|nr:HtaA domain-containing protein [Actinomyces urogenitalis]